MELTLAEFSAFSMNARSRILAYKASLVASLTVRNCKLQLFCMGNSYFVKQLNQATGQIERIYPVINSDMLFLFCKDQDLSALMAD